jgi:hypothetical protein
MKRRIAAVFAPLMLGITLHGGDAEPQKDEKKTVVKIADIGSSVVIEGLLGAPLGEMTTLTAIYDTSLHSTAGQTYDRTLDSKVLRVVKVNGKLLPSPIQIPGYPASPQVGLPADQIFECRGCEILAGSNLPADFIREHVEAGGEAIQQSGGYAMRTVFVIAKVIPAPSP